MNRPSIHMQGKARMALDLTIEAGPDGKNRLAQRHVSFPWSLGRGYSSKPGEPVLLIPQMAGAGLLAGDRVDQRLRICEGAGLHVVSAGAMLAYGAQGRPCSVSNWMTELEPRAQAFLVSEPYVLLDDAKLELRQTLIVAPDATFIGCEGIVCASAGNRGHWRTETVALRPDGQHLFTDRQKASAELLSLQASLPSAWTAFGTVLFISPAARVCQQEIEAKYLDASDSLWVGQSPMRSEAGICIRIAATSGQLLRQAMLDMTTTLMHTARCC